MGGGSGEGVVRSNLEVLSLNDEMVFTMYRNQGRQIKISLETDLLSLGYQEKV